VSSSSPSTCSQPPLRHTSRSGKCSDSGTKSQQPSPNRTAGEDPRSTCYLSAYGVLPLYSAHAGSHAGVRHREPCRRVPRRRQTERHEPTALSLLHRRPPQKSSRQWPLAER
jgi:hypothetical protein